VVTKILLDEYQSRRVTVPTPTPADLRLCEQLAGDELKPKITIRWLRDGDIDVTASSWVGVVRLSVVEIRVVPKLVGGALGVLRMLQYAAAIDLISRVPIDRPLAAQTTDMLDLIAWFLAEETKLLIRDGLLRDYRPVDDSLTVLRGRLRLREQYLRRFGQLQPLECQFDEYDGDTADNQLIAAALRTVSRRVRDPDARAAVLRQTAIMSEICEPPSKDADWYERKIHYGRRNARYRAAHELSKLILRGLAFEDLYDTSNGTVTAFMLDMNVLFERFVTRLVRDSLDGTDLMVDEQHRVRAVIRDDETGQTYSTVRPDLMIEERLSRQRVPVDIKYKLYAGKKLSTNDVYQLFLYAYVHGRDAASRTAGVIYPADSSVSGPLLSITTVHGLGAARIRGAGIDVPAVLDRISNQQIDVLRAEVRSVISHITGLTPEATSSGKSTVSRTPPMSR
jgi:5-methylcytosine-specific restriction enzyme subunit McrC